MSGRWAARLPLTSAIALALLRSRSDILLRKDGEVLWLRGEGMDGELAKMLLKTAGLEQFVVDEANVLWRNGSRIPRGELSSEGWIPLREVVKAKLEAAALPGMMREKIALTLERSSCEQEVNLLITTIEQWAAYASTAPLVRLRRLKFAACEDGRVVIAGEPLPAIPGERLTNQQGIAVAAGWSWSPNVPPAVLRRLLKVEESDLAILRQDGWELIGASNFVSGSRSAARLTAGGGES